MGKRPGEYLVVGIDSVQVRGLAGHGRHGRVHLDGGGRRQEHVVGDSQGLEQVRGDGLATRPTRPQGRPPSLLISTVVTAAPSSRGRSAPSL